MTNSRFSRATERAGIVRLVLGAAVFITMLAVGASSAQAQTACFPTCSMVDGRFLVVPGGPTGAASTFANFDILIQLESANAYTKPVIDIFDGDTGKPDAAGAAHWDQGTIPMDYSMYADLDGDGIAAGSDVLVAYQSGANMPDNAWYPLIIPANTVPSQFYVLVVHNPQPALFAWNGFKVRTTGTVKIAPQTFAFLAPLANLADAGVIYPQYPGLDNTTYDGSWEFSLQVDSPQDVFQIFDGDLDFGSFNCADSDTDDPDTPGGTLPDFALGSGAANEGVATVAPATYRYDCNGSVNMDPAAARPTGNPPDDNKDPQYRRHPSVYYEVIDPTGRHYVNPNPSGNLEWEGFTIRNANGPEGCVTSGPTANADYCSDGPVPAGIYLVKMYGVDLSNLNYWHFNFPIVPGNCICYTGESRADIGATQTYTINQATQTVTIRTTFSRSFADNTYGLNAIGWPKGHKFNDLVGSDHLQLTLYDDDGNEKMIVKLDYISESKGTPSGYKTLCVSGGEGRMELGSAGDVVSCNTSVSANFNELGYVLTTDSPATDTTYAANPQYPDWNFDVWYEVTVKLGAFGAAGFGGPQISGLHASPSKTGNNTEALKLCDLKSLNVEGANLCSTKPRKIQTLTMEFTGDDCSATAHSQKFKKVTCSDYAAGGPSGLAQVYIVASKDRSDKKPYFAGIVPLNGQFTVDPLNIKKKELEGKTYVRIYDETGQVLLQESKFSTHECKDPLKANDQFGGVKLLGLTLKPKK